MLWQDFSHKLADQVLLPLNTYQNQFPEMRVSNFKAIIKLMYGQNVLILVTLALILKFWESSLYK